MEKKERKLRRKSVRHGAEVNVENLSSSGSDGKLDIVSPCSYKEFGVFENNSLQDLKELERQIESQKRQCSVESGSSGDLSCHGENALGEYRHHRKMTSQKRKGKSKLHKRRYVFESSSSSSEGEEKEVRPVLNYLMKCERKRNKDIKDLFSMVINSKQRSEGQITPPVHPSIVVPMEVAPKFRKMEEG